MADLRFSAYEYQHLPLDELTSHWQEAERRGFDVLWNCDTVVEPDRPHHMMFDDLCVQLDRDPTSVRHSMVCYPPLTPWESVGYFTDMVGRLRDMGVDEFVLYWPRSWRDVPGEDDVFAEV